MKVWIPVSLFVIYSFFAARYYVCHIKQVCGGRRSHVEATIRQPAAPITFPLSGAEPMLTDAGHHLLDSLSAQVGEGQILEITGHYYADEDNPTEYADLGLARAEQIKALLSDMVDPHKLRVRSAMQDGQAEGDTVGAVSFRIKDVDIHQAEVFSLGDRKVILFPYGAADKAPNPVIDSYLDKLAEELIRTGRKVIITGHTDNIGSAHKNKLMGLRRAKNIRDYLRKKGVPRKSIITRSKGETEPVATNDTPAGRHQNRRVEIEIQ